MNNIRFTPKFHFKKVFFPETSQNFAFGSANDKILDRVLSVFKKMELINNN